MKNFFLISTIIIIALAVVLTCFSCKTTAAVQPTITEFIGSDFELSLPEKWEGGKKEELDSVVEKLKDAGQTELADLVEANKAILLFFGYDTEMAAQGDEVDNFTITGESEAFLSLDEYMDLSYKNVEEVYKKAGYTFNIIEEDVVPIGDYEEVGRIIFEQKVEGVKTKVAQYIIKNGSDFYVLTFTAGVEQFDRDMQAFDKTIETFKIIE